MPFNPFMGGSTGNSKPSGGGFNVDDLVKRIDAKIAELEEEERQEKAKIDKENSISVDSNKLAVKEDVKEDININKRVNEFEILNSKVENTEQNNNNNNNNGITDDQFFDDFFFDE